jgi:hypothetical protein
MKKVKSWIQHIQQQQSEFPNFAKTTHVSIESIA